MELLSVHANREDWLNAAVDELRPFFASRGYTLPAEIRVACAYPTNAKRSGFKVLGECIPSTNSADGHYEIFISPILDAPIKVTETLIAQLCRTAKGALNVSTLTYARVASAMHLIPAGTASIPYKDVHHGQNFNDAYQAIIDSLGIYPHAKVDVSAHKSQGTRMLLARCPTCQCSIRMTAKWVYNAHGDVELPTCRCGDMFALA
jgi:hypothetical protein